MASVVMGFGSRAAGVRRAPTYALTDNERTVSVDHVCGIAVRNPQIVVVGRHYGLSIATCVPTDPETCGSGACVRSVCWVALGIGEACSSQAVERLAGRQPGGAATQPDRRRRRPDQVRASRRLLDPSSWR